MIEEMFSRQFSTSKNTLYMCSVYTHTYEMMESLWNLQRERKKSNDEVHKNDPMGSFQRGSLKCLCVADALYEEAMGTDMCVLLR